MQSLLSLVLLFLAAVAHAASSSGNRLLVVLEDVADKAGYSQFFGDLECTYRPPSRPATIHHQS